MTDTRRICDVTTAELLDAAIARAAHHGWAAGKWEITLGIQDGHVLRARVPVLVIEGRVSWATLGRHALDPTDGVESEAA